MTQLASDDFNRANVDPVDGNWVNLSSGDPFKIVSNQAVPRSTNDAEGSYDGSISWPNDQYSEATLTGTSGGGSGEGPGVSVRSQAGNIYYRIIVSFINGNIEIAKFNTSYTQLGGFFSAGFTSGDVLRVEVSGSTITVYKNGVSQTTRTDSAITFGKPGISYSSIGGASNIVDNWSGGDLGAAAGLPATFDPIPFMSNLRI